MIKRGRRRNTRRIKSDPAVFYKLAKKLSSTKSQVGLLVDAQGEIISEDGKVAETLSTHYMTVFSVPRQETMKEVISRIFQEEENPAEPTLTHIRFTRDMVEGAVMALSNSAAPGPDGVPTQCLKNRGDLMTKALLTIFQESLDSSLVDNTMKKAHITPIWKGWHKTLPVSYRPVALTRHLSKLMERLIRKPMVDFLEANSLMEPTQHGARARRSTLSQLLI